MMLICAMVIMYSIPCPLITPLGCLYFILKHLGEKYALMMLLFAIVVMYSILHFYL